jgi:hypothetical protein
MDDSDLKVQAIPGATVEKEGSRADACRSAPASSQINGI